MALLLVLTGATVGAVILAPAPHADYVRSVIDKERRLEELPPGKIVLVGGSNVAFGIATPVLSAALHRPAVNMGLHGDIGLPFLLDLARPNVTAGDVIVISAEYESLFRRPETSRILCEAMISLPRPWRFAGVREIARCGVLSLAERFQSNSEWLARTAFGMRPRETSIYSRTSVDEYGDIRDELHRTGGFNPATIPRPSFLRAIDTSALRDLQQFVQFARAHGATTVFMYPAYAADAYAIDRVGIRAIEPRLREVIPVLGSPEDFVYPTSYFFDTKYHLDTAGRELRTRRVIDLLVAAGLGRPDQPSKNR